MASGSGRCGGCLVLILANAVLLWLLSVLLGDLIHARDLLAVLLGGLIVGVASMLLDALVGATPPILDLPGTRAGPGAVGGR